MSRAGLVHKRLDRTEAPTTRDIAWAAGIYEGEGSCVRHDMSACATIGQKDIWLLERMRALFGGSITKPVSSRVCHDWRVFGARAVGFLLTIYALLSPRRQAQIRRLLSRLERRADVEARIVARNRQHWSEMSPEDAELRRKRADYQRDWKRARRAEARVGYW